MRKLLLAAAMILFGGVANAASFNQSIFTEGSGIFDLSDYTFSYTSNYFENIAISPKPLSNFTITFYDIGSRKGRISVSADGYKLSKFKTSTPDLQSITYLFYQDGNGNLIETNVFDPLINYEASQFFPGFSLLAKPIGNKDIFGNGFKLVFGVRDFDLSPKNGKIGVFGETYISPIPVPATGMMLLLALAGLTTIRIRRVKNII